MAAAFFFLAGAGRRCGGRDSWADLPHPGLRRDHRDNADDLRRRRQSAGIEAFGGPGQVLAHMIEAKAETMLGLLGSRPAIPARRIIGAG
jgi:hypothetical protein